MPRMPRSDPCRPAFRCNFGSLVVIWTESGRFLLERAGTGLKRDEIASSGHGGSRLDAISGCFRSEGLISRANLCHYEPFWSGSVVGGLGGRHTRGLVGAGDRSGVGETGTAPRL